MRMPNDVHRKRLVDLVEAGGLGCSVEAEVHTASPYTYVRLEAVHSGEVDYIAYNQLLLAASMPGRRFLTGFKIKSL